MRSNLFLSVVCALLLMDLNIHWPESSVFSFSDEICDNAIDDDGDGLIDLNDEDCNCPIAIPVSLIPNPSFEDNTCCPRSFSELNCAKTWIQASQATTDYLHTCDFAGWDNLPPPLPFPDGEAAIGFRDGRPPFVGDSEPQPNWKEYTGACLSSPLRKGVKYRFEFFIGFVNSRNSPPTTITLSGTSSCENLPFGIGDDGFGCPTNDPNWKLLGSANVAGESGWITAQIETIPEEDMYAIAIGPDCIERPRDYHLYYFFDNLILAEENQFLLEITHQSGHPCKDDYVLGIPKLDTLSYQWYRNGIALIGETSHRLNNPSLGGDYSALLTGPNSCKLTKIFKRQIPVSYHSMTRAICQSDDFTFNGHSLQSPGTYFDTLKTANNCDSIIQLNLTIETQRPKIISAKIASHEHYKVGPYEFQNEGGYRVQLKSELGCDSTVFLELSHFKYFIPNAFSPNNDGNNDFFNIGGTEDIESIKKLSIFDRWGRLVYEEDNLLPNETSQGWDGNFSGRLSPNGVYIYLANLLFTDGVERQVSGSVTLIR